MTQFTVGDIVCHQNEVLRISRIHPADGISAEGLRKAGGRTRVNHMPPDLFTYPSPMARLEFILEDAGLRDFLITTVPLQAKRYRIDFSRPMTAKDAEIIVASGVTLATALGLEEETTTCRVIVPDSWLLPEVEDEDVCEECGAPTSPQQYGICEKCRMREADIAESVAAFWEAANSTDPELSATASEIKRLQSIIDEQRLLITQADSRANLAEAARDDYEERLDSITERYRVANALLTAQTGPQCKEVHTLVQSITYTENRTKADAELAGHLNQGWEVLNLTVNTHVGMERTIDTRIVTLTREVPAPQPEPHRESFVKVIPNSQMTIIPTPAKVTANAEHRRNALNLELVNAALIVLNGAAPFAYRPLSVVQS